MTNGMPDDVLIPAGDGETALAGVLLRPEGARGLVIFAHGSGSSRLSPRNRRVAEALGAEGFATLLFDLLTNGEAADRRNVFDIPLLAARVAGAIRWVRGRPDMDGLPLGLFGASTGAAAALVAAAALHDEVGAVVSRGGRPDLAVDVLPLVRAPTLLIVGGEDHAVIPLNRHSLTLLRCAKRLAIVPGATHLFEEAGAMEAVTAQAAAWFAAHLDPG